MVPVSDEAFYEKDEVEDNNGKISKSSGSTVEWLEEELLNFCMAR